MPLQLPYAPFHVWLLALVLPVSADPVTGGRFLSVLCGVLLAAAMAGAVAALGRAFGTRDVDPPLAAALAAASPFLVFSDRIARPDGLFVLETVLAVCLSLSMATRARPFPAAIAFGLLMGLTMLTRQAISYALWLLPPVAFACAGRRDWRSLAGPLGLALGIALVVWMPMLVAPAWPDLATRVFHLEIARSPLPVGERALLFLRNLGIAGSAFWTYLTPPVFLACVGGFYYLASRRRRLLLFLAGWFLLVLVPAALFATVYLPRYALPAAPPLLVAAALAIGFVWTRTQRWIPRAALMVVVLAWPLFDVGRALASWHSWRLLPVDRRQFVSGWSAGLASQRAAAFLAEQARSGPITVVLPRVSGNPSDAIWLELDGAKEIRLVYAEDFLRLPALRVRGDIWTDGPATTVDADRPVYFATQDPAYLGREGWTPASSVVLPLNPGARIVARFENLPNEDGAVESAVVIYRLR